MLTTASRTYTDAEFDDYSGRMTTGRACSVTITVLLGMGIGGLVAVGAFAQYWLDAWLYSGVVTWTFSLVVGGIAAALAIIGLWLSWGPTTGPISRRNLPPMSRRRHTRRGASRVTRWMWSSRCGSRPTVTCSSPRMP